MVDLTNVNCVVVMAPPKTKSQSRHCFETEKGDPYKRTMRFARWTLVVFYAIPPM